MKLPLALRERLINLMQTAGGMEPVLENKREAEFSILSIRISDLCEAIQDILDEDDWWNRGPGRRKEKLT